MICFKKYITIIKTFEKENKNFKSGNYKWNSLSNIYWHHHDKSLSNQSSISKSNVHYQLKKLGDKILLLLQIYTKLMHVYVYK